MTAVVLDRASLLARLRGSRGSEPTPRAGGNAQPSYWCEANHLGSDNLLRTDNWARHIGKHLLPGGEDTTVCLPLAAGRAILRYREEMKMYANLEAMGPDGSHNQEACDSLMQDAEFWSRHEARISREWPAGEQRAVWWADLQAMTAELDAAIRGRDGSAAFIKLSVRSPKDGVFAGARFHDHLQEEAARMLAARAPDAHLSPSDEVHALKRASWLGLRVTSGKEAMALLLRSDRAYMDILQQELFSSAPAAEHGFDLNIHVFTWFDGLDPDWEFRGFVSRGARTGLTAYNPWVYCPEMVTRKERVLEIITRVWDEVQPHLSKMENYSIDFAVDPRLTGDAWVVEVNNFLPPLAGAGLYRYEDEADRQLIFSGPFEFRVKDRPAQAADFVKATVDPETNAVRTVLMQPAPPLVMARLRGISAPAAPARATTSVL